MKSPVYESLVLDVHTKAYVEYMKERKHEHAIKNQLLILAAPGKIKYNVTAIRVMLEYLEAFYEQCTNQTDRLWARNYINCFEDMIDYAIANKHN